MPELPEVENLRLGLKNKILGQKIKEILIGAPKLVSGSGNLRKASKFKADEFIKGLTGETIIGIERRAKNLIFHFKSGKLLLVHLKMSGQFVYREGTKIVEGGHPIELSRSKLPNKHTHIIFKLSRGTLFYNDIRTFGYLLYFKDFEALQESNAFQNIGPEPLSPDFSLDYFIKALSKKHGNLKSVLLSQSVVAGLGNIYADEVCFLAGVRPSRRASSLKKEEIKKLYLAIKKILPRAIKLGGSSVATYMLLDERRGNFAREHKVYERSGEKCVRCKKMLKTSKLAGRTTVFCANCQK